MILITGCARSGTSLTAGIIHAHGAFGGILAPANKHNKKGMFENTAIRQGMTKPYLVGIGCDKLGQRPLPTDAHLAAITQDEADRWRYRLDRIMQQEGYTGGPRFYKGAKMCLFWPMWAKAFPETKWIIVRRTRGDIVRSCLRTSFMSAYNSLEGWELWAKEHERRFEEMKAAGLSIVEVWPEKMIKNGDYGEMKAAVEFCGLTYDHDIARSFVDPRLWHAQE